MPPKWIDLPGSKAGFSPYSNKGAGYHHSPDSLRRGVKTWDRFKMRTYEPLINLHTPADLLRQITSISFANSVSMLRSLRVTETSPEKD
ncbi:hypothetical protein TELCIR_02177 [Teladorsagia circumcincta]|uniref:Uncharacterized protein n=1 Tax=Teladorsagia circumcincta TaxID=45464 RepID=A0A2G9V1C7_TELCI|nr:hypothetical protein TELCIR_02177 [Teladorsagia circumcincta]